MKKIALALSAALLCQMAMAKGIQTGAAYARPTVEGQSAGGVFVNLKNTDKKDNVLVGASVQPSIAGSTELHTHINENGVMKMREVQGGIPLPAGKTQKLEPGGYHVMLLAGRVVRRNGRVICTISTETETAAAQTFSGCLARMRGSLKKSSLKPESAVSGCLFVLGA